MFPGRENDVKDYLKRQKCGYDGNTFLKEDSLRGQNIDKVKTTLDIITGCKFYSEIINEAVDFEKAWVEFPNTNYKISKLPSDFDIGAELLSLSDGRNALSANSKKPVPETASLRFGVEQVVRSALGVFAIRPLF